MQQLVTANKSTILINDISKKFTDLLLKYKDHSTFYFSHGESLRNKCNAPDDKAGVYLVYGVSESERELIYIGSSGHICNDGHIHIRSSGGGGIKGRIVNGHHFNNEKRFRCWPKQMKNEGIDILEIQWYVTHYPDFIESPCFVEHYLLSIMIQKKITLRPSRLFPGLQIL